MSTRSSRRSKSASGEGGSAAEKSETVYGVNPVKEVLASGRRRVHEIRFSRRHDAATAEILKAGRAAGARVTEVPRLSVAPGDQGIAAVVSPYKYVTLDQLNRPTGTGSGYRRILLADSIQDPQNLGAMIRTVEAAGFEGVVVGSHRAVGVTPAVVKASAGATEHLSVARVRNLADALQSLKKEGLWGVGLDAAGGSIYEADLQRDLVLVVGAEGKGIRPRILGLCDLVVALPMGGRVSSLNASAAVAAAAFQVIRPAKN